MTSGHLSRRIDAVGLLLLLAVAPVFAKSTFQPVPGEFLPSGALITPLAAPGAAFEMLAPGLATFPNFRAGQAVNAAASPDGKTLLVLTSGYNRLFNRNGRVNASGSNEYIFIYAIASGRAIKKQVIAVPNTFSGLAWGPDGRGFYVAGGVDDTVHEYRQEGGNWRERMPAIRLGHQSGLGIHVKPMVAGIAMSADGRRLVTANLENDSVTLIDTARRSVIREIELRPGKIDPQLHGRPGGEYPGWVVFQGNDTVFVSSLRDNEVVALKLNRQNPVIARIPVGHQPNRMTLNTKQTRLYIANGNSDTLSVIDTASLQVIGQVQVLAGLSGSMPASGTLHGANPNALLLANHDATLYVVCGGINAVAVLQLDAAGIPHPTGLIPTGWYPTAISASTDGHMLFITNAKGMSGPNPAACRQTLSSKPNANAACRGNNQYVLQLLPASLLTLPKPDARELGQLTQQVFYNNHFMPWPGDAESMEMMRFLRKRIKHVIYVIKENRSYDQVLGDLKPGEGDPSRVLFPQAMTPNHHALARKFVTLDHFMLSADVSYDGWSWSTAAGLTDYGEKAVPVNYARRGLSYDGEGINRNISLLLADPKQRRAADRRVPDDDDLLPGNADVSATDGPDGETGAGYLWDAALRAGKRIRNYGFFVNIDRYRLHVFHPSSYLPPSRTPFKDKKIQAQANRADLGAVTDPWFRGFDMKYPDYWRVMEWAREFDLFAREGSLPALELVRLPHDHFGDFMLAMDRVNTVETQMADNDYALGLLVDKVSHSRYRDNTLIFIVEDDAQDGADHIDAHRGVAYVIGPYVRQGAVITDRYTTVNMIRTIGAVLSLVPLGLHDGFASPMAKVFDHQQNDWAYQVQVPAVLRSTALPLPPPGRSDATAIERPRHNAAYWQNAMRGQKFFVEDQLDMPRFNQALWRGLKGSGKAYPGR